MILKSNFSNRVLLLLVLILGGILRFYNFFQIPFTHDEFSALFRTGYPSFHELIEKGVLVDFHPAGIQVFLHYYGSLFGFSEWVLKLPFIIMGIGSIYICYLIGKEWFNEKTGLLSAAFISCTQFFVFYSQIARPYSAGLFFGLLAILFWRRLLFSGNRMNIKHFFAWILSASICAYIHYYLLLSLFILGILSLLFSPKERRALFLLSGILIFILYLPHLEIFLHQSAKGGVGTWLGPPDMDFIGEFIFYLFQYSPIFLGFVMLMVFLGFILKPRLGKFWIIAISFFFLSFLAGFFYSIFVNPILQYSGLIFCSPFLLLSIFYWASATKWLFRISFWGILILGSYSLIEERKHYQIFYQSPYEYLVKDLKQSLEEKSENTLTILNDRVDILEYYLDKYEVDNPFVHILEHKSAQDFKTIIANSKAEKLYLGAFASSPAELIPIAQQFFPSLELRKSYYQGEYFVFSKDKEDEASPLRNLQEDLNFKGKNKYWKSLSEIIIQKDSLGEFLKIGDGKSQQIAFEILDPKALVEWSNIFIDMKFTLESEGDLDAIFCVLSLEQNRKISRWYSRPISEFMEENSTFQINGIHSLAINQKTLKNEGLKIRGFIYNPEKMEYKLRSASFAIRAGNPKLYSLYTPIGN